MSDREHLRRAYMAFRVGARLQDTDVARLLAAGGLILSNNRLRELGRDSDRGKSIAAEELRILIEQWRREQRPELDTPRGRQ